MLKTEMYFSIFPVLILVVVIETEMAKCRTQA
jgi:hypothetical protein